MRFDGATLVAAVKKLELNGACSQWNYLNGLCDRISSICEVLPREFARVFARVVSPICNGGKLNCGFRNQRYELFNAS